MPFWTSCCQRHTEGGLAPLRQHGPPLRREENDSGPLNMLLRPVAILHDGGRPRSAEVTIRLTVCAMRTKSHSPAPL